MNELYVKLKLNREQQDYFKGEFGVNFATKEKSREIIQNQKLFRTCPSDCKCSFENNILSLYQHDDISIKDYSLIFQLSEWKISVLINGKKQSLSPIDEFITEFSRLKKYLVDFDINKPIEKIYLEAVNGIVDTVEIDVVIIKASVEKYNKKKKKEQNDKLIKSANIKVSTGSDLVNIYFQPCCNEYNHTSIELYKDDMLLATYTVKKDIYFKSINGLAYGEYEFILKQFDKKETILIETDKIPFEVSEPIMPHRPCNVIC